MSLRRLLLAAMSYLLVLALVAFGLPLALSLRQRVDAEVRFQARSSADVLAISTAALLGDRDAGSLASLASRSARSVRGRVVIVDARGVVLADSSSGGAVGVSYATRPEIAAALRGRRVQDQRRSDTLGQELLVTSSPVVRDGRRAGALRITQGVGAVERSVRRNIAGLAVVAGFVLLLGLGVAAVLARRIARPLLELEAAANKVAAGDLTVRAREAGSGEQRSLSRAFNTMTERVARALRAQQEFVADASHHLRTPLTGLRLRLEGLHASTQDPEALGQIAAATDELDRLSRTIDELLILSTTGERETPGERVELAAVARSAVARWEAMAADGEQEIALAGRSAGQAVWASRVDVERALDVLVENALRYSPRGTTVTVVVDGSAIDVVDEGPGLAAEDTPVVFERFRRGTAGRAGPAGTGLGLAIARELTRRWGGEATLVCEPGGGARGRLQLPPLSGSLPGDA